MSVRTDDETAYRTLGVEAAELERYTDITFENGDVVIYDEDDDDAWVQSASAVGLEFMT